ncbi:MAG: hypothetical protein FJ399_22000 [Verrucomicrobia bacterium]|nr:hypothetical protein [Verrucomicrobiota bacterium]
MPDEADPPRKFYQFKPKGYDVLNERVPPPPPVEATLVPDPGPVAAEAGRIDVKELIRQAGDPAPLHAGRNRGRNENEVYDMLREQYKRDLSHGHYELGPLDDSKRRRRIRNYWLALVAINVPLGSFAAWIGPGAAIPFVCAIAGMSMSTALLTWQTFFFRTHY